MIVGGIWLIILLRKGISAKQRTDLEEVESCLILIEENKNSPRAYDNFIEVWKLCISITAKDLFVFGYYNRILEICEDNSSNVKAWQVLENVLSRINISFGLTVEGRQNKEDTLAILFKNLFKEFRNQQIRQKILSLIYAVVRIKKSESQYLYEASLKVLEANPSSQEARLLVLNLGRLHYGLLRPNGRVTIFDEQAIQNDIIVRSR